MKTKLACTSIALALGLVGLFVVHKQQKTKEAEKLRTQQETNAAVSQLASHFNAVTDWEKQLSKGEKRRNSLILTIELERIWQADQPVLFIGKIKDVSSAGPDDYQVAVEKDDTDSEYTFATELRLHLRAPKSTIDSFLQEQPKFVADSSSHCVAVVAKITNISSSSKGERDSDGDTVEVPIRTGNGRLLGLVYIGGVSLRGQGEN